MGSRRGFGWCRVRRSRKQAQRERLTAHQVRERNARKRAEADRALWLQIGGTVAWEQEQNRRRRERNERTRERTRQALAAKRAEQQETLFPVAS